MSEDSQHEVYLRRALQIVESCVHRTSPNPKVGCVIVQDGEIIGEGVTQPVGGPHAEVMALKDAGEQTHGATAYVTLEPCCHYGRTPPCTEALIAAGITRVVIGVRDPNPRVDGGGIAALENAGIEVVTGVLAEECEAIHAPFFHFITHQKPWVILKAAITIDGQIATQNGDSKWITSAEARTDVHRTRAHVDAVMVGGETARLDNPRLTVRLAGGSDPIRVILDSALRLPTDGAWCGEGCLVYTALDADPSLVDALRATQTTVVRVERADVGLNLHHVMDDLASRGLVTVLVEGGGTLHGQLLAQELVQAAQIYIAPRLLGRGRPLLNIHSADTISDAWRLSNMTVETIGDDLCLRGQVTYPKSARDP